MSVDPHRLAAAMETAGFPIAGRGRGHIRFAVPGDSRRSLIVPLDVTAEGDAADLREVLADLAHFAAVGAAARKVLDALADCDEGAPLTRRTVGCAHPGWRAILTTDAPPYWRAEPVAGLVFTDGDPGRPVPDFWYIAYPGGPDPTTEAAQAFIASKQKATPHRLDALADPDPSPPPDRADSVASRLRHAHQTSPLMRRAQREEDSE